MKHLYMMRHGQTLFNIRRRIQGSCDSPLTELGIKQAKAAKELIKDIPNGVNLRSWLFFIAIFPIISVYLWCCS